ncbi:MAG: O-antigen ligase family protein [Flexilinea sp.]
MIQSLFKTIIHHRLASIFTILTGLGLAVSISIFPNPIFIIGLILGAAGAIFIILNYEMGLVLCIMIQYMNISFNLSTYYNLPSIGKPLLVLLIAGVGIKAITTVLPSTDFIGALVLIVIYMIPYVFSILTATDSNAAMQNFDDIPKDSAIVLLIVLITYNMKLLLNLAKGLAFSAVIMGSVCVFQYITKTYSNIYMGFGKGAQLNIVSGKTEGFRTTGVLEDPNYFAQIMIALVPICFILLLLEKKTKWKIFYSYATFITIMTIIITFSRGGFLALAISIGIYFVLEKPGIKYVIFILFAGIIGFGFLPSEYQERIFSITDIGNSSAIQSEVSFRGRASEAIVALEMIGDYPLTGVGPSNYPINYQRYSRLIGLDPRTEEREAHNLFLQIGAEQGLFGLIIFCFTLFLALRGIFASRKELIYQEMPDEALLTTAFICSIGGYLACSMFLHNAYFRYYWIFFGIMMAIPGATRNSITERLRWKPRNEIIFG